MKTKKMVQKSGAKVKKLLNVIENTRLRLPWENIAVVSMGLFIWGTLSYFLFFSQITNQVGDTTFIAQILYNFKHSFVSNTSFGASTIESIDRVWYRKAQEVCSMDLVPKVSRYAWWHLYFVMYLLLPLARIMDVQLLIALVHAGIYTSVLVFAYLLCRKKSVNRINAVLFSVLVTQHPLWNLGLTGQFYFNRLFLPFSALLILLIENKKINYFLLILASLLAASTNEIYGIVLFMIFVSYVWIYKKLKVSFLFLAFFFLFVGAVSVNYLQRNMVALSTQNGFIQTTFGHGISGIVMKVIADSKNEKTPIFLIVNILSMGFFVSFYPRLFIPLFLILVPNLFVNIGGAEKIGWATHYHMGYFVPLMWLSILGFARLNEWPKFQASLVLFLIVIMSFLNPYTLQLNPKLQLTVKTLINSLSYHRVHGKYDLEFRERLRSVVGEGKTVSAPEAIAYNLYDHDIFYYPMNIDAVDVVIFRVDESKQGKEMFYTPNYGHQDHNLDTCIIERMEKQGFDLSNPTFVHGWAVINRKTKP